MSSQEPQTKPDGGASVSTAGLGGVSHACCVIGECSESTCMALPIGKTCGDCARIKYCAAVWGDKPTRTVCGYFPRRFSETPNDPAKGRD